MDWIFELPDDRLLFLAEQLGVDCGLEGRIARLLKDSSRVPATQPEWFTLYHSVRSALIAALAEECGAQGLGEGWYLELLAEERDQAAEEEQS